jgi:hypothetical protein
MPRKTLLSIVLVALCLTPVGLSAVHSKAQQEQTIFKITYVETRHLAGGEDKILGRRVRFVDPFSGQSKETRYPPEGKEIYSPEGEGGGITFLISRQGYFHIKNHSLEPIGEFFGKPVGEFFGEPPTKDFLEETHKKDSFGTHTILGYTVYGRKTGNGQTEIWTTLELGINTPLRIVNRTYHTDLVAMEISKETGPANFFDPQDLPMDLYWLDRGLAKAKDDGDQADVERYTRLIKKWRW